MKLKQGVTIVGLHPRLHNALKTVCEPVWIAHGQELVVTEGVAPCRLEDPTSPHMEWSLHSCGCAVDLRTHYFSMAERLSVAEELVEKLGPGYDVVLERTHIHIEWDYESESWAGVFAEPHTPWQA